ncbi:hypothetical protein PaeCFBP13512_12805 [Paenibacillus sp. CFBP13512]|uniref:DoxX family protein n=1 Tax=Paenibacillus sp. CFBP13512 TaxID=2184007 RepID=UPI0010C08842|nr:DoxX family protein [Paenibacillus sp. CFBP13512]TKJ90706.1 hypothetical protein PaeCFBP13512_12805 [Paenibacillus sp. CFBP13512]
MIPFYVLIISFLIFKGLGLLGLSHFDDWHAVLQGSVAVMLFVAASAHWGSKRVDLIRMVPAVFPRPHWIVTATGLLEIAGAIGIIVPVTSRVASIGLALLFVAMFPANILASRNQLKVGGKSVPNLFVRSIVQVFFIIVVLLAG